MANFGIRPGWHFANAKSFTVVGGGEWRERKFGGGVVDTVC